MSSPFANYPAPERSFIPATPISRQSSMQPKPAPAKRGRKPKVAGPSAADSPRAPSQGPLPATSQGNPSQWSNSHITPTTTSAPVTADFPIATSSTSPPAASQDHSQLVTQSSSVPSLPGILASTPSVTRDGTPTVARPGVPGEDDVEAEDELLPAMADDDYSAQLSFQSQSKDNLKVLMDNFNSSQYDRFEAYRRHALPKQAVRKVIQQTLGQQVSQPVAQIVAGFGKVFVGEIVEKARAVQERRGESGPLSPDHLREAYRLYQQESGRVGAARPLRSKRLFVR